MLGAVATIAMPERIARWAALAFAAATFVLSMVIFFRIAANGYNFGNLQHPADSIQLPWIDFTASSVHFRIDYFLGVDGLSLPMVILNAFLSYAGHHRRLGEGARQGIHGAAAAA